MADQTNPLGPQDQSQKGSQPFGPGSYFGGGASSDPGSGIPSSPLPKSDYVFAARMKDFKTTVKIPPHQLKFDEQYFLNLLAGSISLTRDEKKRIVEAIPKLRQEQIDELIRILEEERAKFIELSPKHAEQLKKLEEKHAADWKDLEALFEQEEKAQEDQAKADEIRKKLGL